MDCEPWPTGASAQSRILSTKPYVRMTTEEEDLNNTGRAHQRTRTLPASSCSSSNCVVSVGRSVGRTPRRGPKPAAGDEAPDCGQDDPVGDDEEMKVGEDASMDSRNFLTLSG